MLLQKKLKKDLLQEFDILDTFAESCLLSDVEKSRMCQIREELDFILKQETKAWQRSRDRFIKEGDRNTSYFHAIASQRRRKKKIVVLDGPSGPVESTSGMLEGASNFYKNLFGKEDRLNLSIGPNFWDPEELITVEENDLLQKPFSVEEINQAVFDSYSSGAPRPDGLSFLFLSKFLGSDKK